MVTTCVSSFQDGIPKTNWTGTSVDWGWGQELVWPIVLMQDSEFASRTNSIGESGLGSSAVGSTAERLEAEDECWCLAKVTVGGSSSRAAPL